MILPPVFKNFIDFMTDWTYYVCDQSVIFWKRSLFMFEPKYYDGYQTPTETINGEEYQYIELDHHILRNRRTEFGMTQQQVANAAGIQLRQYQRFENGERTMASASMRIGLSICLVLKLNPYRFVTVH